MVEDERVVAMHLRQQLSRLGYQVPAMATGGRAGACSTIRDLLPDVVLMDIHIEGDIDGIETAARIPPELHIPVIYLTAYSEEATLERARLTKPYGYLLKPFSERELHAAIQMVLERRRADSVAREGHAAAGGTGARAHRSARPSAIASSRAETAERLNAERALASGAEDGGRGPAHGRRRARFQQSDADRHRQSQRGRARSAGRSSRGRGELSQKAMSAAQSAAVLTQRLLAFARRQPLAPKPININALLQRHVRPAAPRAR